jgi:basic amino acid/polyamine antiporter, APA family
LANNWQPKLGNKFYRPRRLSFHLKRSLGVSGLFSAGYGDVGSSIYYGLGVVALAAQGFAPIALAAAGLIYIANALSYSEGGAMIPEAGGSASFARHAFNDMVGFISGWALMLSYVVTMALSSFTIPPYLSYFAPALREPFGSTVCSMGIILFLMFINIVGVRESSRLNIFFIFIDIATQVSLVIMGVIFILLVNPGVLIQNMFGPGNVPTPEKFVLGIALAALCFTGVETVSQLAEETRKPAVKIPRAYIWMIVVVMVLFAGISITALSAMSPQVLGDPINGWAKDPIAGIAANLPNETVRNIFGPLVALLAASILLTATNAGMLGISRLAFNMSKHKLLPDTLAKVHSRFRTPYVSLFFFCSIVLVLLTPGFYKPDFFVDLGGLYVFGSLLCFAFAHAAILGLRVVHPEKERPFKLGLNIKIKQYELPLTAIFGLLATVSIWILILITQDFSRWVGFAWMISGFGIYYVFRRIRNLPLVGKTEDTYGVVPGSEPPNTDKS